MIPWAVRISIIGTPGSAVQLDAELADLIWFFGCDVIIAFTRSGSLHRT